MGAHLAAFAAGAAAFALACAGLAAALPFPEVPAISPKLRHLQEHRDAYDVLFVGSSRFYHQIIPPQFDAAVGALPGGEPVRSFNCAYDAVWPPESLYLVRQILALRPARLKYVVLEAIWLDARLKGEGEPTRRDVYWHDLRHTRMALAGLREQRRLPEEQRKVLAGVHRRIFLQEAVSLGRGAELLGEELENRRRRAERPPEWAEAAGYFPGSEQSLEGAAAADFLANVRGLERTMPPAEPLPVVGEAFREISAEIRAAGAVPVFVVTPTTAWEENLTGIPGGAALLKFNDPRKYPALFRPETHYDPYHLNARGAQEFTAALAQEFQRLLAAGGAK